VTIDLEFRDDGTSLEITDDGVGFNPTAAREAGGMGLLGIEQRVESIGGTLNVESMPGRGSTVRVEVRDARTASSLS
jgi:signal transduction histidine kinase